MNQPPHSQALRIALAIEDVGLAGGQERVIAELIPRIAPNHDLHLFCFTVQDVDLQDITVHRLYDPPLPLGPRALWFTFASTVAIRPGDFDIILSQGGNTLVQNAMLAHTGHRERRRIRRRLQRRFCLRSPLRRAWEVVRDRAFVALETRAVGRCRGRIMAVSRSIQEYFLREYDLSADDVHVTRNGVDHSIFTPELKRQVRGTVRAELGLSEDDFVALFMGGLWHEKSLVEVIDALPLTEHPVHLVIAGSGDRETFAAMAEERGVRPVITFAGHVDRPQDYFAMADCLVHPNPEEPFGLVTLESAACGLPVIAARTGAALDLIDEGVTGLFVEPDPHQIARALDQLAADPERRNQMAEAIHRRSLQFSWDRQAEEIEELLIRFAEEAECLT